MLNVYNKANGSTGTGEIVSLPIEQGSAESTKGNVHDPSGKKVKYRKIELGECNKQNRATSYFTVASIT